MLAATIRTAAIAIAAALLTVSCTSGGSRGRLLELGRLDPDSVRSRRPRPAPHRRRPALVRIGRPAEVARGGRRRRLADLPRQQPANRRRRLAGAGAYGGAPDLVAAPGRRGVRAHPSSSTARRSSSRRTTASTAWPATGWCGASTLVRRCRDRACRAATSTRSASPARPRLTEPRPRWSSSRNWRIRSGTSRSGSIRPPERSAGSAMSTSRAASAASPRRPCRSAARCSFPAGGCTSPTAGSPATAVPTVAASWASTSTTRRAPRCGTSRCRPLAKPASGRHPGRSENPGGGLLVAVGNGASGVGDPV